MTNELKLERTLEQWEKCVPIAMSQMSEAAIMFAFIDAKKDIAALAEEIAALKADAGRYRWLKSADKTERTDLPDLIYASGYALRGDAADKVIDAAMNTGA